MVPQAGTNTQARWGFQINLKHHERLLHQTHRLHHSSKREQIWSSHILNPNKAWQACQTLDPSIYNLYAQGCDESDTLHLKGSSITSKDMRPGVSHTHITANIKKTLLNPNTYALELFPTVTPSTHTNRPNFKWRKHLCYLQCSLLFACEHGLSYWWTRPSGSELL